MHKINIASLDNNNGITLKKKDTFKNNTLSVQNLNVLNEINISAHSDTSYLNQTNEEPRPKNIPDEININTYN